MQLPKAMSMWTMSRYLEGVRSIGLPGGALGMVVQALIEAGNLPLSMNDPSFDAEIKCNNSKTISIR